MRDQHIKIIYEDNHLIAANKPVGMLTQGDETGDWTLMDELKKYIRRKYNKPGDAFLGSFHRIDRVSSGVVIYAKTSKALVRMNETIRDRKIKKQYYAVVDGRPSLQEINLTHYLEKDKKKNISKAYDMAKKNRKESSLSYTVLAYLDQVSLLDIQLHTGRSHQIRVQLSKIGYPIVGDKKYGAERNTQTNGIALHCKTMSFIHPVKKEEITIKADFPRFYPWSNFKDFRKED